MIRSCKLNVSMFYFYILRSLKNKKLYLGYTPNLKERVKSHNDGENKATKPNIPYELIYYSAFKNKHDAIACEKYFKTTAGWKRINKTLENVLKE
ncbi:MAG: GIY-YIG nuclease family protein [Nanoarchaeota archaeon]